MYDLPMSSIGHGSRERGKDGKRKAVGQKGSFDRRRGDIWAYDR